MSRRLGAGAAVDDAAAEMPAYVPEAHGTGIVHLGVGAFHKAHQAVYTDSALSRSGGDWRILGVSLRSPEAASALNPQDGRYTLLVRESAGTRARIVSSIAEILVAPQDPQAVVEAIAAPHTRIVTLTITEKAYGIDPATGGLDLFAPAIAADLANPAAPSGAVGFLVAGLALRASWDGGAIALVSCDNLSHNGRVLKRLVLDFAGRARPEALAWIAANVRFPSTMVDRITPATTARTLADAQALTGFQDEAAVETEPFSQWVIEDDFPAGRPDWEAGGALFVADTQPFEKMKLRMLNGAHSLLAYAGFIAGYETVAAAMTDPGLARLADRQMRAAASSLSFLPDIDLDRYRADLIERFRNPAIRHLTYQIAMDGSQKLPLRIFPPIAEGVDPEPFAFAIAAWMRYCLGVSEAGEDFALRDPREAEIKERLAMFGAEPEHVYDALASMEAFFPASLVDNRRLRDLVVDHLRTIIASGMADAVNTCVARERLHEHRRAGAEAG